MGRHVKKVLDKHDMYADGTELCSNARNAAIIDFGLGIVLFVNIQSEAIVSIVRGLRQMDVIVMMLTKA